MVSFHSWAFYVFVSYNVSGVSLIYFMIIIVWKKQLKKSIIFSWYLNGYNRLRFSTILFSKSVFSKHFYRSIELSNVLADLKKNYSNFENVFLLSQKFCFLALTWFLINYLPYKSYQFLRFFLCNNKCFPKMLQNNKEHENIRPCTHIVQKIKNPVWFISYFLKQKSAQICVIMFFTISQSFI